MRYLSAHLQTGNYNRMQKILRNISVSFLITIAVLTVTPSFASDPMNDVFALLDSGGGTRLGKNKVDGYYVVAMGMSGRSSESKAYEEARLNALRQLTEMINGVTMSGSTTASMEYVTVSNGADFSRDSFVDIVNTQFKGQLSAAKMLKKGNYDGDYFVAISIAESDVAKIGSLRSSGNNRANNGDTNTVIISTDASN